MKFGKKASAVAAAGALATVTIFAVGGSPAVAQAAPAPAASDPPITHEENPRVPEGAAWTEAYFPSSDGSGVVLHADVLRPANLPATAKTPVILSVGPYFAHAGQTGPEGWDRVGPSARFQDFVDGAHLMARGYTVVMVDLRGFGGSTGCLDWVGPGEQADVRAAIKWSAGQRWSTGKVGMYGKSYDAVTGLVGNDLKLPSLKAVVAQEPVWNMYNYLFSNEVPRPNVTGTPEAYNSIATMPPMPDDSDRYKAAAEYETSHPQCLSDNITNNNNPDLDSAYWSARNLAAHARGTSTPLFVTQGMIEPNTKPEDAEQYLDNHHGRERGWLGQWEHVR
ncbi:MAG TPA: CocE/NonD family hydrolase, partial [Kribbella sp.]